MPPIDPALEAAIRRAVEDAVGATVPYAHAGTVIGSLAAVIVWTWLFYIPKLDKKLADSIDARLKDKDSHLELAKQTAPVLDRAIEALKVRGHGG